MQKDPEQRTQCFFINMTNKPTAVAIIPKAPTAIVTMYEAFTKNVNKNENKMH